MKTASKVFVTLNLCWRIPLFALYFLAALTLMAGDPVFAGMTGLVGVGLLSGMIALFIVALIFVPGIVFGFIALVTEPRRLPGRCSYMAGRLHVDFYQPARRNIHALRIGQGL